MENVGDVQRAILANHREDVMRSVISNLLIYALGRSLDVTDDAIVEDISRNLAARRYRARDLVSSIILSRPFLEK